MKALSILQPWASLWAATPTLKRYETRSWDTKYRGPLAIHASLSKTKAAHEFYVALWYLFLPQLTAAGLPRDYHLLPFGAIIATTDLAFSDSTDEILLHKKEMEHLVGDFTPGRFAWQRGPVTPLACPIPAKGRLGLWNCPLL